MPGIKFVLEIQSTLRTLIEVSEGPGQNSSSISLLLKAADWGGPADEATKTEVTCPTRHGWALIRHGWALMHL